MKAIITVGISGSGKSTWADRVAYPCGCASLSMTVGAVVINRDETRWKLSGKYGWNGPTAYKFDKQIEKDVTDFNTMYMKDAAFDGKDIIIADTNLNPKTRDKIVRQCNELGYLVEIKEFPISFQEACKRDKERGIFAVGEAVLMKQWEQWVKYWEDKQQGAW